jgi:putative DNA primase/helicase
MNSIEFQQRVKAVKARTQGRWTEALSACGVDPSVVNRKNQPCPLCGGTDRFQYTDWHGDGGYFCRSCGPGDPFKLLQGVTGLTFVEALSRVEEWIGQSATPPPTPVTPTPERMKRLCQKIWCDARPIALGDEVDRYLRHRGIAMAGYPRSLRFHPALGYYEKTSASARARKIAEYPAMIACVQGADGHAITLHRTYLTAGRKALGDHSKKILSAGINGAAVRLGEPADELAITEGIETGLAVHLATGKPVWAALNCGNMTQLWIPDTVQRVCIYADNDANAEFAGEASAYALAQRLVRESKRQGIGRRVQVFCPKHAGDDWADVWLARVAGDAKAA